MFTVKDNTIFTQWKAIAKVEMNSALSGMQSFDLAFETTQVFQDQGIGVKRHT